MNKLLICVLALCATAAHADAINIRLSGNLTLFQGHNFFAVPIQSVSAPRINVPFNVTWTASGAQVCQFLGSPNVTAATVSGWTRNDMCLNSACDGQQSRQVTIKAPGDYWLGLVCTNNSGYASASVVVH